MRRHCFGREGADIILNAEITDEIALVADEVRALGRKALPLVADMMDEASIPPMLAAAMKEFGHIDSMVYSAGVAIHGKVAELSVRAWDLNFGVNVRGMFLLTRALLPIMLEQGHGTIVNISSKLGKEGSATRAAYSASKHAVIGLTKSLALEMKAHGIRVKRSAPVRCARRCVPGTTRRRPFDDHPRWKSPGHPVPELAESGGTGGPPHDVRGKDRTSCPPSRNLTAWNAADW